ncbi:MAG: TRAP transporter small permease [Alphaproteobacteria bacterium]|nr:TRAP transporter small permease [Alphaproteobacteria bacterium]
MAEAISQDVRPTDPVGRALMTASRWAALFGGVTLCALAVMTVVSVVLRWLTTRPIPGDFELVQLGMALVIFAFLPWCHMRKGNVLVDVFTVRAPKRLTAALDAFGGVLYCAFAVLLLWRMHESALDKYDFEETTMRLALPVWPVFAATLPLLALLVATTVYRAVSWAREASR